MHPLLRCALAVPRAFRARYCEQIGAYRGNVAATCADIVRAGLMLRTESMVRDLALALRALAKAPVFALVAVAAVALAIGANVAVAGVLKGVLLDPLPYAHAGDVYYAEGHVDNATMSYQDARDIAARSTAFAAFGAASHESATLYGAGRALRVDGRRVDEDYFGVLGLPPQLGRLLGRANLGTHRVVISDELWRSRFGADPAVIGRRIDLDGTRYTVVGVARPEFRDPAPGRLVASAYWIPVDAHASSAARGYASSYAWSRLRPGVSLAAAQRDFARIMTDLDRRYRADQPQSPPGTLTPALTAVAGPVRPLILLLYAAVAVLLAIACANLANLSLVRAAVRERELVVRSALGASRARIAAQLAAESFVIAAAGGVAGLALGSTALRAFAVFGAQMLPRWETVHVDAGVIGYCAALVVATTVATGLLPAMWVRRDVAVGLKSAGRSGDRSASKRLRSTLVAMEIGLAIAVVVSAGVITRSFIVLTSVPLGFDGRSVVELDRVSISGAPAVVSAERDRLLRELRALPGVRDAAASFDVPFGAGVREIEVGTRIPATARTDVVVRLNAVTTSYFRTLGIALVRGRVFDAADRGDTAGVAVVNAALARRYFGTLDVLGRAILPGISATPQRAAARRIVGVVGDARYGYGAAFEPEVYVPMTQLPVMGDVVIRTDGRTTGLAKAVDDTFARVDPQLAPPVFRPFPELLALDALRARAAALLFAAFAVVALFLALSGIYAVTSYSVEQRTQEFGIRRAIGATARRVIENVLRGAVLECAAGVAIGFTLATAFSQALSAIPFQTSPLDPAIFGGVVALLAACTLVAALVPALRATRVPPAVALRYE